jgi:hypothetical protein
MVNAFSSDLDASLGPSPHEWLTEAGVLFCADYRATLADGG